jgi:hypothetical protein
MGTETAIDLAAECRKHGFADRGIHRSYEVHYAGAHTGDAVLPFVLLEMGVRGGPEPAESRSIRTMLAPTLDLDEAAYQDLTPLTCLCYIQGARCSKSSPYCT